MREVLRRLPTVARSPAWSTFLLLSLAGVAVILMRGPAVEKGCNWTEKVEWERDGRAVVDLVREAICEEEGDVSEGKTLLGGSIVAGAAVAPGEGGEREPPTGLLPAWVSGTSSLPGL